MPNIAQALAAFDERFAAAEKVWPQKSSACEWTHDGGAIITTNLKQYEYTGHYPTRVTLCRDCARDLRELCKGVSRVRVVG